MKVENTVKQKEFKIHILVKEEWDTVAEDIMQQGIIIKSSLNSDLRDSLLSIVECYVYSTTHPNHIIWIIYNLDMQLITHSVHVNPAPSLEGYVLSNPFCIT
jgi:hypothetical protein